jgi:hypothetical protein
MTLAFCTNCGSQLDENQRFCTVCGSSTSGVTAMPPLSPDEVVHAAQVRVGLSLDPPRQSRWSVLLRGILSIPLLVVAIAIGFVAGFVTLFSWFAALFTGRVPNGFQNFLTGALRFYANVLSYSFFLTSRWPGVAFSAKRHHQVTVDVDHVRLNRAAVFFRLILLYPANIVNGLLLLGSLPFVVVMWLWGIVAGKEPRVLHQSVALVVRYQIRLQAYVSLITPTQPFRGLFGDGFGSPTATMDSPLVSTPDLTSVASVLSDSPEPPTRWIVTKTARAIVIIMLILGIPVYIGVAVAERPLITKIQDAVGRTIASASYTTTLNAMSTFESSVQRCTTSGYVGCAAKAATTASSKLNTASSSLADNAIFPSKTRGLENDFAADLDELQSEVKAVQFSTLSSTSRNVVENEIPQTLGNFIASYKRLKSALA